MEANKNTAMEADNWTEKQVERYFCKKMEKLGCQTYKFVSPGCVGVPDRIVILPGGMTWFVELKRAGGEMSAVQWVMLKKMYKVTGNLKVISGKKEVDAFYDDISELVERCRDYMRARERYLELKNRRSLMEQDK